MDIRDELIVALKRAIEDLTDEKIVPQLEHPKDESHGDYSTNIAMTLWAHQESRIKNPPFVKTSGGKQEYKSLFGLAQKIVDSIIHNSQFMIHFDRIEAVKPGFINFWVSKEYLVSNLEKILDEKKYGSKSQDPNKKVVVEYSSPNIAKPFTVGHLRSTIIGDAIANLLEANGWKVYRDNHLGDWGTQFGKQIAALKYISLKDGRIVTNDRNILTENVSIIQRSDNKVKILVKLYQDFYKEAEKNPAWEGIARAELRELENENEKYESSPESRRFLWKKCIEWSWEEFEKIYQRLGITFTENGGRGFGESDFVIDSELLAYKELKKLKEFKKGEDGAKLVFFPNDKYPPLMLYKKDGATLYATRDLATDKFRLKEYGKDVVIINEVGIEQALYFRQLFELEKMLGWVKDGQRIHKRHGHYRFKDKKMSTRKGNIIWLEEVLQEAIKRAEKLGSEGKAVAEKIGIGALKWNDLKRSSPTDIVFDWDEILNMQGDSGPYIQYTFARTHSVLKNVKKFNTTKYYTFSQKFNSEEVEPEELSLLRTLYRFPEIVEEAGEKFSPNLLCNYLFDLAQKFNLFYQKHKIIGSKNQDFRLLLTQATGQVVKNGLQLLGIKAPEQM